MNSNLITAIEMSSLSEVSDPCEQGRVVADQSPDELNHRVSGPEPQVCSAKKELESCTIWKKKIELYALALLE